MDYINKINLFIEKEKYFDRDDILGIVFYGSSLYGTNNNHSDVDLLIITYANNNFKGTRYIDGTKIEFFEKSFLSISKQIEALEATQDNSLLSLFKNGKLLYGDENTYNYLKEQINYSRKLPKINKKSQIKNYLKIISEVKNSAYKNYFYYNLIDKVRQKYHEEKGYSLISGQKAPILYNNCEYAKEYYCLELPNQDFIEIYTKALNQEYNEKTIRELLNKVNYNKCPSDSSNNIFGVNEIKNYSTAVESYFVGSINALKEASPYGLNNYYLAQEKIRILYCMINSLNISIEYFNQDYDNKFMEFFDLSIKEISIENITNLFDYVTSKINIDYRDYKIVDLKR